MLTVRRVVGNSMLPTLHVGQIVVAAQWPKYKPGQVVVVHFSGKDIIKRIVDVDNGIIFLQGDNNDGSTDSRHYGGIKASLVKGRVVWPLGL